jgi:hypothetical protein
MRQRKTIETTLGELIVALTDEALEVAPEPSDAYQLVACILADMAVRRQLRSRTDNRRDELGPEHGISRARTVQRLAG